MAIQEDSATPLYKQLENTIERLIASGEYKAGMKLPTEEQLCERFGVSRVTVRKALKPLADSGILERRTGKGTFVAERKITRSLSSVMSFSEMCHIQGCRPGAKLLRIDLVEANDEQKERLALGSGRQHVLVLERLRYADDSPVMVETAYFPDSFFFLMDEDLNNVSLYSILAKHGIQMTSSSKTIDIARANYKESKYLGVPVKHPLLCIDSIAESGDGEFRHLTHQICNPERFTLYV